MLPEADLLIEGDFSRWTVVHAIVREALSASYEAELIVTNLNRDDDPAAFLGVPLALRLTRGDPMHPTRRLQGVVRALEDLGTTGTHRYARLVVVPWLWTLTQRSDSRIFQDMPAVEVVKSVLRAADVYQGPQGTLTAPAALGQLPSREYCVQYRERDFDFVLRLLQEEGVPFYFRHDGDGGETLVLVEGDSSWSAPALLDHGDTVSISDTFHATATVETLVAFDPHQSLRPTGTTLREFDFTRPRLHPTDLTHASPSTTGPRALYDYPARAALHQYDEASSLTYRAYDGSRQARIRQEAEAVTALVARGRGNVTSFAPGQRVMVEGHHAAGADGRHLIVSVEHRYHAWADLPADVQASERLTRSLEAAGLLTRSRTLGPRYENRFEMIPASVPYRPARSTARPLVHGNQTARVVGPAGEEIYVDPHGRIKVQFHWDREGVEDEESSCWIRCAQAWAGSGWGFVFIPRVGMEVVVTFLEGDPDRPLVTGCVYNGENRPPYALPGEKTKSTVKTNSSPTTGGYNEIRFEDRAGEEQLYVQAERDHDTLVKRNQTLTVQQDRTKVVQGHEHNTIVGDRTTVVQSNESKEVLGNQEVQVQGLQGVRLAIDHNYVISAGDTYTLKVGEEERDTSLVITPSEVHLRSRTIKLYADQLVDIRGGLVKINCPEEPVKKAEGKKKKETKIQRALRKAKEVVEKIKKKLNALLKKLPKPLANALRRAFRDGLSGIVRALVTGHLPDFAALGRNALGTMLAGARVTAQSMLGGAMRAIGNLPVMRDIPGIGSALDGLRDQAMGLVNRGLNALGGFAGIVGDNPAWYRTTQEHPAVARQMLQTVGYQAARQGLPAMPIPRAFRAQETAVFDASRRAVRDALGAAAGELVRAPA